MRGVKRFRPHRLRAAADALLAPFALGACGDGPAQAAGGDVERGRTLIPQYGCGACHGIPGITAAHGTLGPPLPARVRRAFIAGRLPSSPGNLRRWILDPPAVERGTALPNLGVSEAEATDIAACLCALH